MKAMIIGNASVAKGRVPGRFAQMAAALAKGGIDAEYSVSLPAKALVDLLRATKPEIVFSFPGYTDDPAGSRRNIHGLLESERVAYVGSSPETIDLALLKPRLKALWKDKGVDTPAFMAFDRGDEAGIDDMIAKARGFPYIVKPAREGNSRGLGVDSVVRDASSLRRKVFDTIERFGDVFAEEFIDDDVAEFTVAMIGDGPSAFYLPAEIRLKGPKAVRVITTEDKEGGSTLASPVDDPVLGTRLAVFAARALEVAGARDYARCDILMSKDRLLALEVNGQPMIPDAWFDACARGGGFDTTGYLNAIMLTAIARQRVGEFPGLSVPPELAAMFPENIRTRLQGFS